MIDPDELPSNERAVLARVKVNAPATRLKDGLLEKIVAWRVHPEVGLDGKALDTLSRAEMETLARKLDQAGLKPTVHGPFMDLAPGAADRLILEATRRRMDQSLETAALFHPLHVVYHANYDETRYGDSPDRWLETSLETWRPLSRRARELGFGLVLENVYENGPEELARLLEALAPEGVGFCLDVGHATVFGRASIMAWLEALRVRLAALHLHDNHGRYDEHLAIGRGRIDFQALFAWLNSQNLQPLVTMEPHYEEQLRPSLIALAKLWPWSLD
ncbi:MAG: sugar phosphate isomerase/epimerase family protein [Thermodesulfobacteriota bacterium]